MNTKTTRGFTLLEMMVATVIMAIAIVGLLSAVSGSLRNAARLTEHDRAVQLGRMRMNELLVDYHIPRDAEINGQFDPQLSGGLNAGWRARLSNFEMPPQPAPGQVTIDQIRLEIWWMSGAVRRTYTLDAYRPRTLRPQDLAAPPPPGAPQ